MYLCTPKELGGASKYWWSRSRPNQYVYSAPLFWVCVCMSLFVHPSVCLFVHLSMCLSVCVSLCVRAYMCVHMRACMFMDQELLFWVFWYRSKLWSTSHRRMVTWYKIILILVWSLLAHGLTLDLKNLRPLMFWRLLHHCPTACGGTCIIVQFIVNES